jgi:hypothetical protein
VKALREFGRHGGLCELSTPGAIDSTLLRNIFFNIAGLKGKSHNLRRQSLLLILDLCQQFSSGEWVFNEPDFAGAVYFGELVVDDECLKINVPSQLVDIANRWKMFYFHNFMGVALEGLFCWIVAQLRNCGLAGDSIEELVGRLNETVVRKELSGLLKYKTKTPFGETTPHDLFAVLGLPHGNLDPEMGKRFDVAVRSTHAVAEDSLETLIRESHFVQSPIGLAIRTGPENHVLDELCRL